jgi:hypothetical protein
VRVRMVGGGGGGGASGTTPGSIGANGGNTTFGTSLLVANGGESAGQASGGAAAGGTASLGSGPTGTALTGGDGPFGTSKAAAVSIRGGAGAPSPFGGGGAQVGPANTGSGGGGGAASGTSVVVGNGGASGGFVDAIISGSTLSGLSGSAPYAVGSAGVGQGQGTNGADGFAGGSGYIEVTEYYQ